MITATRTATSTRPDLREYLRACGGKDILYFDDPAEAGNAAHTLRARVDEVFVKVEAQYDKVFLKLKGPE